MLPSHNIAFGFNLLEVSGDTGRHYGALLSVKEHHDVATEHIDAFLQLPQEFIVTETFDFVPKSEAQSFFERQHEIQSVINDTRLQHLSQLDELFDDDAMSETAYGEHQITIMLLDDKIDSLEKELLNTVESFSELGVTLVREDMFMEECYWAQLPANFEFVRRLTPIRTKRIGGYASLYNFPAGKMSHTHWDDAVTVFHTAAGTPYFFNFHYEDNGHTLIIGPYGSGKTVLMNFLVSEARKFSPKLYYCDQERHSEIFIRAIGGTYLHHNQLAMNPFSLPDSQENRAFLYNFLHAIITENGTRELETHDQDRIVNAINFAYTLPKDQRQMGNIIPQFWPLAESDPTSTLLANWYGDGEFASLFDNAQDVLPMDQSVLSIDFHPLLAKGAATPVLLYFLHRIYQQLDGSPTMIVLDEAWKLVDNPIMAPKLSGLLEAFRLQNTMVIFATESAEDAENSHITDTLTTAIDTQIYLPNSDLSENCQKTFHLSNTEMDLLASIHRHDRQFLLKHGVDAVVAELSLEGMNFELHVLSATIESLALMDDVMQEAGEDNNTWLPLFKQRLT